MVRVFLHHFPARIAELPLHNAQIIRFTAVLIRFPFCKLYLDESQISRKLQMFVSVIYVFVIELTLDDMSDYPCKISILHLLPVFLRGDGFFVDICDFLQDGDKLLLNDRL